MILTNGNNIIRVGNSIGRFNDIKSDANYVLELNETTGTVAYDQTINNNNFTIAGNTEYLFNTNGKLNGCYFFINNLQSVSKQFLNQPNRDFTYTMSFWLHPNNHDTDTLYILQVDNLTNPQVKMSIKYSCEGHKISVEIVNRVGDTSSFIVNQSLNNNGWNHIAISIKQNSTTEFALKFFVNGVKLTNTYTVTYPERTITPLKYNTIHYNYGGWYSYYLDQLAHFSTELTDQQILRIYNDGLGREYSNW